ncbi:hypothetical protein FOZ62_030712, partial [Perkinsus olseni]
MIVCGAGASEPAAGEGREDWMAGQSELNQDIQDRMAAECAVLCSLDNQSMLCDRDGNKCPLGYFFCLQCSVSFKKLGHIQVHWDTCDCHENGNGSRDIRAPPLQPLKAADLVVKSEVVDGEVDYTQPDEDQCSLVDLCSSDEEIDGGRSNDYINPSPLPIPARRRNQTELDKVRSDASDDCTRRASLQIGAVKVRTKASSSSSSPEGTYKSASSAASVDFDRASTPSTYCPSDFGSPR